ncbi:MAG: hypothetical protein ACKVU1_07920 [bacterium]
MIGAVALAGMFLAIAAGQGRLLVWPRAGEGRGSPEIACLTALAGLAMTVVTLYSLIGAIGAAVWWIPLGAGVAGWCVYGVDFARGARPARRPMRLHLLVAVVLVLTMYFSAARFEFPLGHDPVFHAFLADKIRQTGRLASDWTPWASIGVNYTQGLHLVLAFLARWTGLAMPLVFESLHFWFGVLSLGAFWVTARIFLADRWAALAAALAVTFAARLGGFFSYLSWGGLPTVLAHAFFFGVLILLFGSVKPQRPALVAGVLLAALAMVSHLGAFIAAWVLGAYVVVNLAGRRERADVAFLGRSVVWQIIVAAPFLFTYLPKAASLARTDALRFTDEGALGVFDVASSIGFPLLPLIALGVFAAARSPRVVAQRHFLVVWLASLGIGFLFWDRVYRAVSFATTGVAAAAFTPSRFLTLMVYPLAILSSSWIAADLFARRPRLRALSAAVVGIACVAGFVVHALPVLREKPIAAERVALYEWVRRETPEDAFVLYEIPLEPGWWRYYIARRSTCNVPIPASEPTGDAGFREQLEVCDARDMGRLRQWLARRAVPGYLVVDAASAAQRLPAKFELVATNGAVALLRLRAAEARDP